MRKGDKLVESEILRGEADDHCEQAEAKSREAFDLLKLACEKYELASEGDPDNYETLHNWAVALVDLAETGVGEWRRKVLAEAEQKLIRADALNSEFSSWVLAGIVADQGREQDTRKWLERAVEAGVLKAGDQDLVEHDTSFEAYRDKDWFRSILSKLRQD